MKFKFYTGVGSRNTPENITDLMSNIAVVLYGADYTLRSGRADGSDYAFQRGAEYQHKQKAMISSTRLKQEIYVPNKRFNVKYGRLGELDPSEWDNYEEAEDLMFSIHPKGQFLRGFAREAHIRNMYQVLGRDLNTPSEFLICYAETDRFGNALGGTASAWKLATRYNIPCYNLGVKGHLDLLYKNVLEKLCEREELY